MCFYLIRGKLFAEASRKRGGMAVAQEYKDQAIQAVISGTNQAVQVIGSTAIPKRDRKRLKKRIKSSENWQLRGKDVYNSCGMYYHGIASWSRPICVRLDGQEYRFRVLNLDRFKCRTTYLLPTGGTVKSLPGLDLTSEELRFLQFMADELSSPESQCEHLIELKNPLRDTVMERASEWAQEPWNPEDLLELLEKNSTLLSVLTAALDSQLRTLKQLCRIPIPIYNFLLPRGNPTARDWLLTAFGAVTFSNEESYLPGPIIANDLSAWRQEFRRLTIIDSVGQNLLSPLIEELRLFDQGQKSGSTAKLQLPTLPISVSKGALCSPFAVDVAIPSQVVSLSAGDQDLLRTAMGRVLTKGTANAVRDRWRSQMFQPRAYRLSGYAVWRHVLADEMCRRWFSEPGQLSRAVALLDKSQVQQEAQERQRWTLLQKAYKYLTNPERYAGQIIERPANKSTAEDMLADTAFAFRYKPARGEQKGEKFLAFNKNSLLRLLACANVGLELLDAFLELCTRNGILDSRDKAITLGGETFHAITFRCEK